MKIAKIFKLGQKGAKRAKKMKGGAAQAAAWPEGTRVGVFGHENSGKTVFFTALYTQSKTTANFHVSVRDNATANEFFKHDMAIKGVDVDSGGTGTIAAKSVPKRFPDRTVKDIVLQFTAILDGNVKVPVVTYDYNGKAASISDRSDEAEKIRSFMADADGLLFFFDPKVLGADPEVQARVSSFVNILELIVSLKSRLPIPVGLVITKADSLSGFSGEDRTILIRSKDEQVIAEDYETFLEKVLGFDSLADDREWAASVRIILVKLREFIRVVVGRTLDFQIFFVSSTGNKPEKIGVEVGRSLYAPPDKVNPCGVTEPFRWILKSIIRSRRLTALRRIAGFVVAVSAIWIALYSLPFMIHFGGLLRSAARVESKALKEAGGNHRLLSAQQTDDIFNAYRRYGGAWLVKRMFPEYQVQAQHMKDIYGGIGTPTAGGRLDAILIQLSGIIADEKSRPVWDRGDKKVKVDDATRRLLDELEEMHSGDENEPSFKRSERALFLWNLFEQHLQSSQDPAILNSIWEQVAANAKEPGYNEAEARYGEALQRLANKASSSEAPSLQETNTILDAYAELKGKVNDKEADPAFVLGEAAEELRSIASKLTRGVHAEQLSSISQFISATDALKKEQKYVCIVKNIAGLDHVHIEVTKPGGSPSWSEQTQYFKGDEVELRWKPGDEIYIAYDEEKHTCKWGNQPSDMQVFDDEYALYQLDGKVSFSDIGKTVTLGFKGGLRERLPKLK